MVNKIKSIITVGAILLVNFFVVSPFVFAEDKAPEGTDTAILPNNWGIENILNLILTVVTTGVGIAAVGSIAFAGVLYMTAANNAQQVSKAKTMITNTVLGIVAYIFMWSFLQWIIPGGLF